jgi:[protein-PII] uridylyltransferase
MSRFTIIDIFTHDRTGLLYAITRTLLELGLSLGRAKIGTYLHQVIKVFYVTDHQYRKVKDNQRLEEIRKQSLEVIEQGKMKERGINLAPRAQAATASL